MSDNLLIEFPCDYPVAPRQCQNEDRESLRRLKAELVQIQGIEQDCAARRSAIMALIADTPDNATTSQDTYSVLAAFAFSISDTELARQIYQLMRARLPANREARLNLAFLEYLHSNYSAADALIQGDLCWGEPLGDKKTVLERLMLGFVNSAGFKNLSDKQILDILVYRRLVNSPPGLFGQIWRFISGSCVGNLANLANEICASRRARFLYVSFDELKDIRHKSSAEIALQRSPEIAEKDGLEWFRAGPPAVEAAYGSLPGYDADYLREITHLPPAVAGAQGIVMTDQCAKYVNVKDGERFTPGAHPQPENTIWVVGPSHAFGPFCEDQHTFSSQLQAALRSNDKAWRGQVRNLGVRGLPLAGTAARVSRLPLREGDTVIMFGHPKPKKALDAPSLHISLERPHDHGEHLFVDMGHLSWLGYRAAAKAVSKRLATLETVTPAGNSTHHISRLCALFELSVRSRMLNVQEKERLDQEVRRLSKVSAGHSGTKGSVTVNCDPMTLGHLSLIEHAAGKVDHLYVLVIENPNSMFTLEERKKIVRKATRHLANVTVTNAGRYICSPFVFPEYSGKSESLDQPLDVSFYALTFAVHMAPALGIEIVFFGDEPTCPITHACNLQLRASLGAFGVRTETVARLEKHGEPISAGSVRQCLAETRWLDACALLPAASIDYLVQSGVMPEEYECQRPNASGSLDSGVHPA